MATSSGRACCMNMHWLRARRRQVGAQQGRADVCHRPQVCVGIDSPSLGSAGCDLCEAPWQGQVFCNKASESLGTLMCRDGLAQPVVRHQSFFERFFGKTLTSIKGCGRHVPVLTAWVCLLTQFSVALPGEFCYLPRVTCWSSTPVHVQVDSRQ